MKRTKLILVLVPSALLFAFGLASASDDALPADIVIAAIQQAVAEHPGLVKEVEVEREHGRLFVEVEILSEGGREIKVMIDPENITRKLR